MLDAGRVLHEPGWRKPYTLNEQVEAWRHIVESAEDGYTLTIDDFTNDLAVHVLAWDMASASRSFGTYFA